MTPAPSILWLRLDFRLADQPALRAAIQQGGAVIPVYIHATDEEAPWAPGAASRWWLHQSLREMDLALRGVGSRLIVRRGPSLAALLELVKETRAHAVFWNRRYEPAVIERDAAIKDALRARGLMAESSNAALLREPWAIQNQSGRPFQVFTAFWKRCLAEAAPADPLPAPRRILAPAKWPRSLALDSLELEPKIKWANRFRQVWQPGENGAQRQLQDFLNTSFSAYTAQRNRPDAAGTSRLSPHLHFGEISPRQIWRAVRDAAQARGLPETAWRSSQFLTEIGWREFSHHLLYHFPRTPEEPLRPEFQTFPWRADESLLQAWQKGRTGYPIVDAGLRELWATGWMHNRVRMITASFLVKDLLLSWSRGARWFWDTLVDADLAQNTLGWQWTAGCGADAAPYFRVFNPITQGEKFDPEGNYVRQWLPELAKLPDAWLHKPWQAPVPLLDTANVRLDHNYPRPIVSHGIARQIALDTFARLNKASRPPAQTPELL